MIYMQTRHLYWAIFSSELHKTNQENLYRYCVQNCIFEDEALKIVYK